MNFHDFFHSKLREKSELINLLTKNKSDKNFNEEERKWRKLCRNKKCKS